MIRIRRTSPDVRLEMTPLLDVVFLLLTFFVFAIVLMVRADVLGISLPALGASEPVQPSSTITIALTAEGSFRVNGDTIELASVPTRVLTLREENPDAVLLVAADADGRVEDLLGLVATLREAGITDVNFLDRPRSEIAPINENAPPAGGASDD